MTHPQLTPEEIVKRGQTIYEERIRADVETEDNIGKQIVIDVETGDYEIDADGVKASHRLRTARPDAVLYGGRIGYNAVYSLGGTLTRTAK